MAAVVGCVRANMDNINCSHSVIPRWSWSTSAGAPSRDSRQRPVTRSGTLEAADTMFTRVAELVGGYAPAAAAVTEAMLRRDDPPDPFDANPACPSARQARRHTHIALLDTRNRLAICATGMSCANRSAACNRTASRWALPRPDRPPLFGYLIHPCVDHESIVIREDTSNPHKINATPS